MSDQQTIPTPPDLGTPAGRLSPRFLEAIVVDADSDPLLRHLIESWRNPAAPSANELADALLYLANRFKLFRDQAAEAVATKKGRRR
jgi:hypothetical protein